jgi:amino acid transporter
MAKTKKFGTFSGVFTPSILTILGVIMYLRLPWIVGQAGLFAALGIVLIAHLISITTGLSVSSIATDKKVKAGGTYYIISRSLGLPIGGTLGLALFVGLSFSVSLYLIGFSEIFLSYWGFEVSKTTIRITGTLVLLFVTGITFLSTKLAIRTQFYIMAAIVLSLSSIIFGSHSFEPSKILLTPSSDAVPFIVMFGIFFPAVTGFEAGVSMSGDLQDSKKSIPKGTISAILVGLIVYVCLVFFFSYTVESGILIKDPQVLLKISFLPELVIAGIWGATLSSAFGSILGAPRILQATAKDKITPKFFSKGFGALNEPRNALLLTFAIAEAGILIGELDVIARIVSMFFITAYGFLNLSYTIENWAGSDFHPEFRVPIWISLLGAAACFVVMIQLDPLAMILATVLLGGLFAYLQRKELKLNSGDAWNGFWDSVVRFGLIKLKNEKIEWRNWRPNIILFSGGSYARPYLIDLGKVLVGKLGILSNFDLIENTSSELLFTKAEQSVKQEGEEDEDDKGVFTRRNECRDIYEGMEIIASMYGFSGIEPNTIFMGWPMHTKKPMKFAHLLKRLNDLDYNSLFLNYDDEKGFGDKKRIDIWWHGGGNNFSLAATLARFIISDEEWRDGEIRLLTIKDKLSNTRVLEYEAKRILQTFRIDASVKIIDNQGGTQGRDEIFREESETADLSMFGIPPINEEDPAGYIENINSLLNNVGTTLLINASSFFTEIKSTEEQD